MPTVDTYEKSSMLARPVELYVFDVGGDIYRYASRRKDFVAVDGHTYSAERLSRSKLNRGPDFRKQDITIQCPGDFEIAEMFKTPIPGAPIDISLFRTHTGASDMEFLWSGRVGSCTFESSKATLECQGHASVLEQYTIRKTYQKACSHALYGTGCGVDKALHTANKNVDSVSSDGLTITSSDLVEPEGHYLGGIVEANGVHRTIVAYDHVAQTITLAAPIKNLVAGSQISCARGCDRTITTCDAVFNNKLNFMGFIHIPEENPFTKDLGR